ncbi:MAG: hypothetical protein HQK55_17765 [Deltaproteobacteria bacterium]|nr:hypothetical protein [Deltaproteobacteria bacterium]
MKKGILLIAILVLIAGCASRGDIWAVQKFEPIRVEGDAQIYKFTAFADSVYPLDSTEAEKTRIGWLETWLIDHEFDAKRYEIVSRTPVLVSTPPLSDVYDIYYEVRAYKP